MIFGYLCLAAEIFAAVSPDSASGAGIAGSEGATHILPLQLSLTGDHAGAAVEYRRLALAADSAEVRAVWRWAAALEHLRAGAPGPADRTLDRAELDGVPTVPLRLLRAKIAEAAGDRGAAVFYWRGVFDDPNAEPEARSVCSRLAAAVLVRENRVEEARCALESSPADESARLARLVAVEEAPRRAPWLGGLLGLVPGLGYAYSGEYGNAARSLILNGIFIGLMVFAAREEQWAAFGVAGFFEVTWYSGSVYGGIDAAHRWNRRILDEAADDIRGSAGWSVEMDELPRLVLKYRQ